MKTFLKYSIAAALVAVGLSYIMEWSFMIIFVLLEVSYGVYLLHATHPRLAKWLSVAVVIVLASGWCWSWFRGNLPLSYANLPWGRNYRDVQVAKLMDPGLSKTRAVLMLELRKKEDALASEIPALMQAKKYEEIKTNTLELINLRMEIEKLLAQTAPAKPAPTKPTPTSTMSSGRSLTVELQPDQAYDIDDLITGQHWRYTAFNGTFEHRIDKGDDKACWKVVDNNLPWNADYAGKLQVKAGNTSVKLTVNIFSP